MDLPSISKIKNRYKEFVKKICQKKNQKLFSCLGIASIVILLGVFISAASFDIKSLYARDFYFLANISSQNLFISPAKNFLTESPEMVLLGGNSMKGVSSPLTVSSQVLGSVLGGVESVEMVDTEVRNTVTEYEVEPGDTLSSIAEKFDISLNTILWANDLTSKSAVKKGQKLIILPVSGILHLVQSGDTISGLAKMYKSDAEEITAFNNLSHEGDIFIGDVLIIPEGVMPAKAPQINTIPLAESYFIFPCEGKITQGLHGPFRNAIDISNKCGKIVVAAAGGVVQRAGPVKVGGNRITILHPNGVVTYYGHLSSIAVAPGQTVSAGQVIGYVGNTGYTLGTTGCHLHFEVLGANNFLAKYPVGSYLSW